MNSSDRNSDAFLAARLEFQQHVEANIKFDCHQAHESGGANGA